MAEYIDIESLRKQIVEFKTVVKQFAKSSSFLKEYISGIDAVMEAIDKLPITDVKEVRHGRWVAKIMRKENYNYGVPYEISRCSECLYMLNNNGFVRRYNYCPNCGARMDGEE